MRRVFLGAVVLASGLGSLLVLATWQRATAGEVPPARVISSKDDRRQYCADFETGTTNWWAVRRNRRQVDVAVYRSSDVIHTGTKTGGLLFRDEDGVFSKEVPTARILTDSAIARIEQVKKNNGIHEIGTVTIKKTGRKTPLLKFKGDAGYVISGSCASYFPD